MFEKEPGVPRGMSRAREEARLEITSEKDGGSGADTGAPHAGEDLAVCSA